MSAKKTPKNQDPRDMSLVEHLEELRLRISWCLLSLVICAIGAYFFRDSLVTIITSPYYRVAKEQLMVLGPAEAFMAKIKISVVSGGILAMPIMLIQAWKFVSPGLYHKEKRFGFMVIPAIVGLFVAGVACGYLASESVLGFFLTQGVGFNTQVTLSHYLSFMVNFVLAFGFAFQLPVLVIGLTAVGLIKPKMLKEYRAHIHVVLAALSAVLMPGDIATMLVLWIPLMFLFEGTFLIIKIFKIGSQHWIDGGMP